MADKDKRLSIVSTIAALFKSDKVKTPDTGELGRAVGSQFFQQWKIAPYSPDDLMTSKGWAIYDKMQQDAQIKAALMMKKFAVLAKPWFVKPASDSPKDVEVAEFVTYALRHVKGQIGSSLFEVLDALAKGYSIAEKVWGVVDDDPDWKDKWVIKEIKSKDPSNFTFDVDEYLNVKGLLLTVPGTEIYQQWLPLNKFIVYTYNPKYNQPWGQSDLRAAYKHWWCKDFIIKWWQVFIEKYAMPTLVGYYKSGLSRAKQEQLLNIMSKIASDTAIIIPEEVSEQIKEIYMARDPRIMYESAVAYHDTSIAKAILGETLTLESPGRGASASFAMAKVHQETLLYQLTRIKQDLEETVVRDQIIKELVWVNFGYDTKLPSFEFAPLQAADITAIADAVWKLGQVGMISPDEQWVRDKLGWPHMPKDARTLQEIQAELQAEKLARIMPRRVEQEEDVEETRPAKEPGKSGSVE